MRRRKTPWYTTNRRAQETWKARSASLPEDARRPGRTMVETRDGPTAVGPFPVCLPLDLAEHNLLPSVRAEALERFARHEIAWHHGTPRTDGSDAPSTHVLDSQVQCVNTLLSLSDEGDALLSFVRAAEPEAVRLVDVEDGRPVAFEWDGDRDWLGEVRRGPLRRGRYRTSVDAFLVAERGDGGRTAVLVEWKFTESYDRPVPCVSRRGTDRRETYRGRYKASRVLRHKPPIDAFFHEPHYQQLRLVLLAEAVLEASPFGADRAVVVDAVPAGNRTLRRTVPEGLATFGETVSEVWEQLMAEDASVRWVDVDTGPWTVATPELAVRYGGV